VGGFIAFSDIMVSLSPSFSPTCFSLFKGFLVLFSTSLLISNPFGSLSSSLVEAKTKFYNCEEVYWIGLAAINAYNDWYSSCISGNPSTVCQYMEAIEQDVVDYLSEQDCATHFACSSTNSTSDIYTMCHCEQRTADDDVDASYYLDDENADDDDSFTVSSFDDDVVIVTGNDDATTTTDSSSNTITVTTQEWILLVLFFIIIGALLGVGGFSCGALCFSCLFGKKDRKRRDYIDQDPMMNRVKTYMDSGATTGSSLGGVGLVGGVLGVGAGVVGGVGGGKKDEDENENKGYHDEFQDDEDAPPANIYDEDDGDETNNNDAKVV